MLHTPITFLTGQLGGGLLHHLCFNPQQSLLHIEQLEIVVGDFPVNASQDLNTQKKNNIFLWHQIILQLQKQAWRIKGADRFVNSSRQEHFKSALQTF